MESSNEHKYILDVGQAVAFLERVSPYVTPLEYDRARSEAWTRTTYLDTDDLAYLRSSSTPTHRRLRVRQYAAAAPGHPPVLTSSSFVELKENTGSRRSKIRCSAPPAEVAALLRGQLPADNSQLTGRTNLAWIALLKRIIDERPRPRVTTWYRRETLVAEGGAVRITIDAGFSICEPVGPEPAGCLATPPVVLERLDATIVEVKLSRNAPAWLTEALKPLEEKHGFSKFGRAMEAVISRPAVLEVKR